MKAVAAELAFLGQVFLKANAAELSAIARDLQLPGWEQAVAGDAARLEREYNRLFFNPLGSPCPLWQSANTDEGRLMGEAHLSALEWYRQLGVEPSATNEPGDHVGLLVLFYAQLIEQDAQPETVERFRAEHLDWISGFCDTVRRATTLAFYRDTCDRLREMVEHR